MALPTPADGTNELANTPEVSSNAVDLGVELGEADKLPSDGDADVETGAAGEESPKERSFKHLVGEAMYRIDPRFKYTDGENNAICLVIFVLAVDIMFTIFILLYYMLWGCSLERMVIDADWSGHAYKDFVDMSRAMKNTGKHICSSETFVNGVDWNTSWVPCTLAGLDCSVYSTSPRCKQFDYKVNSCTDDYWTTYDESWLGDGVCAGLTSITFAQCTPAATAIPLTLTFIASVTFLSFCIGFVAIRIRARGCCTEHGVCSRSGGADICKVVFADIAHENLRSIEKITNNQNHIQADLAAETASSLKRIEELESKISLLECEAIGLQAAARTSPEMV
mmetsp:Transcript_89431/g.255382  ORF Transcript_89431/g.255382 Transcript_89431/m.255382 type:complete len:338 (+) Transcript_89431:136-1149(+)|eukprot:CAMPEP_0119536326 /NCGR_PEP_ID=MMETSP1344-20130328/49189_1 /TAXON_ID=236787 /ORGANISM="Florenciella parvula, Strain CCMP2471" /LENGTH=337 /DNA_ID=CAMNT_0007578329 /DNA_START=151 /DNA_END=1164 /DNA_ORIENTATION=-